jgi:CoA:oxalate CoA-transferase
MHKLPLNGVVVLEFAQYLAGPSAGLRLADLGARVIKIEHPLHGDACRKLAIKNLWKDDSSLLFHTINRNKESFAADLKNPDDLQLVKKLVSKADVLIHNFRPGVMEKIGIHYTAAKEINPKIIYAHITGYGNEGPWKNKPGQDLLIQALSGLTFHTGNADKNPVPFGLAVSDMMCGAHLVQGILAALIRRQKKGVGALVEVSLLESILDFQFELLTTYYASGQLPQRSHVNHGHPLLGAPYGIYKTIDGWLALAMTPIGKLKYALSINALDDFTDKDLFAKRDEIKKIIADLLLTQTSFHWIEKLMNNNLWAMPVMSWEELRSHPAYAAIQPEQQIITENHSDAWTTTRCPIRINARVLTSERSAPSIGRDNSTLSTFINS